MIIVSDSSLILLRAQEFGFATELLGKKLAKRKDELVLIVFSSLEDFDLSPYSLFFSVFPFDDSSLECLLLELKKISLSEEENKIDEQRFATYFYLLKEASNYLKSCDGIEKKRLLGLGRDLYHDFLPLLSLENNDHLLSSLMEFALFKKLIKSLKFYRGGRLPLLNNGDILLPLEETDFFFLHCELLEKKVKGDNAVLLSLLFRFIKDFLKLSGEIKTSQLENDGPWEKILSKLETLFVFLGTDGTLLLHHQDFSRLAITPRECLQLKSGDKIERLGQVFFILTQKINDKILVTFRTEKAKLPSAISNRELGVVSSSIAHELNNPLAGMLAAISLLLLEDLHEEETKALLDMKKSIERCKGLVEIFLGFSRISPHQHIQGSLSHSFSQAMNLLRFRMVESSVRLNIETHCLEVFQGKFNPSVMAMFFYIVLNEVLTIGQKNDLLMDTSKHRGINFSGIIRSELQKIELSIEPKIDLQSLLQSRLLSHLTDLLEMRLELQLGKMIICAV